MTVDIAMLSEAQREFPILPGYGANSRVKWRRGVPWSLVEPHRQAAMQNHYQTLERLAARGGLSPSELVAVIEDRKWSAMPEDDARAAVEAAVRALLLKDNSDAG